MCLGTYGTSVFQGWKKKEKIKLNLATGVAVQETFSTFSDSFIKHYEDIFEELNLKYIIFHDFSQNINVLESHFYFLKPLFLKNTCKPFAYSVFNGNTHLFPLY